MTRWFYSDPLAAAWMCGKFGMCIYTHGLNNGVHPKRWQDFEETLPSLAKDAIDGCEDRYYIHPESLHLLDPQVGDLCLFTPHKYGHIEETEKQKEIGGKQHEVVMLDGFYEEASYFGAIIQRNGIAFMWPESEEP